MSQVTRQRATEIQAGKKARAGDVSAELNHLIVGINDNDSQHVVNAGAIADNETAVHNVTKGELGITIKDLITDATLLDTDGAVVVLSVTVNDNIFTVGDTSAFEPGRIQYIVCDPESTEDFWAFECAYLQGMNASLAVPKNAVVQLTNTGVGLKWSALITVPSFEERYTMASFSDREHLNVFGGTHGRIDVILDGTVVTTLPHSGTADWDEKNIDMSAASYGPVMLRLKCYNDSDSNYANFDYLVDHRYGFELMTIGGSSIDYGNQTPSTITISGFYIVGQSVNVA